MQGNTSQSLFLSCKIDIALPGTPHAILIHLNAQGLILVYQCLTSILAIPNPLARLDVIQVPMTLQTRENLQTSSVHPACIYYGAEVNLSAGRQTSTLGHLIILCTTSKPGRQTIFSGFGCPTAFNCMADLSLDKVPCAARDSAIARYGLGQLR